MIASNQPSISGGYYGIHRFYVAHPYPSLAGRELRLAVRPAMRKRQEVQNISLSFMLRRMTDTGKRAIAKRVFQLLKSRNKKPQAGMPA
jgi:hypothetical protein